MDLSGGMEDVPAPVAGSGEAKKRGITGSADASQSSSSQEQERMMVVMGKPLLSTTLKTRIMVNILLQVLRIEANNQYLVAMTSATTSYAQKMKSIREKMTPEAARDLMGLPCSHAFNALVSVFIKDMEGTSGKEPMAAQLKLAVERWGSEATKLQIRPWEFLHRTLKICRHEKMFGDKFRKLVVHAPPVDMEYLAACSDYSKVTVCQMWYLIKARLLAMPNSKELPGIPPPGDLERQVQSFLDKQEEPK